MAVDADSYLAQFRVTPLKVVVGHLSGGDHAADFLQSPVKRNTAHTEQADLLAGLALSSISLRGSVVDLLLG